MIKEAMDWILYNTRPFTYKDENGNMFCDRKLHLVENKIEKDPPLTMKDLTGMKNMIDYMGPGLVLYVENERTVDLLADFGDSMEGSYLMGKARYPVANNGFMQLDQEDAICTLLTQFEETDNLSVLHEIISTVKSVEFEGYDDGLKIKVAKTKGVHIKEEKEYSDIFSLKPFYTFPEIEQPVISYVFRTHNNLTFSLIPIMDEKYNVECIQKIRDFFSNSKIKII